MTFLKPNVRESLKNIKKCHSIFLIYLFYVNVICVSIKWVRFCYLKVK